MITNSQLVINQRDPSQTTTLRNAFVRDMNKRFRELRGLINTAIVEEDVFALRDAGEMRIVTMQSTPGRRAFNFTTSQAKVNAFMAWLQEQVDHGILSVSRFNQLGTGINAAWTNLYIEDSYRRGVQRARTQLRQAGYDVPTIAESGGISAVMSAPFHIDRLGLLYTRTFRDLKNITDAMSGQISRVLTQGMADGLAPRTIARQLNAVIRGGGAELGIRDTLGRWIPAERRARMLARTEIIRAHAEAQLQEYKNWGVEGVNVKAEWVTAGDNRVCQLCADLEGSVFTIEQATNMIPLHVSCRCAWLPYRVTDSTAPSESWRTDEVASQMKDPKHAADYMKYKAEYKKSYSEAMKRGKDPRHYLQDEATLNKFVDETITYWQGSGSSNQALAFRMRAELMEHGVGKTYFYKAAHREVALNWLSSISEEMYLRARAFGQVYLESLGTTSQYMYRGVAGDFGKRVSDIFGKNLKRTKYNMSEGSLVGYSTEPSVGQNFGLKGRDPGFVLRRSIDNKNIIFPDLSKWTTQYTHEYEWIVKGLVKEKVRMKDFLFKVNHEGSWLEKEFGETLAAFLKRFGLN